jgi:hypothetical protein
MFVHNFCHNFTMKHSDDEKFISNNDMENLLEEAQVQVPPYHPTEVVAEHIPTAYQQSMRNDISTEGHLLNVVITSFQSVIDANTKVLERRLDAIDDKFHEYAQKLRSIEERFERESSCRSQSTKQHGPIREKEEDLKGSVIDKSKIVGVDRVSNVKSFENSNQTRTYRSSAGRLVTAQSASKVGLMSKFADGQKWTTVPSRGKSVFLQNIYGSFLCAHPDGKVESRREAGGWEQWTIGKNNDGSVSLICSHGWYLSDKPENGLCVTKKLGHHKWWL